MGSSDPGLQIQKTQVRNIIKFIGLTFEAYTHHCNIQSLKQKIILTNLNIINDNKLNIHSRLVEKSTACPI